MFTILCTRHDGSTISVTREDWSAAVRCAEDGWYTEEYVTVDIIDETGSTYGYEAGERVARYDAASQQG